MQLSKALSAPILSADSRQVYRELNIGTAKPTSSELKAFPHALINHVSITTDYNVGQYERDALDTLDSVFQSSPKAILCGGSGLHINAVLHGLDSFPNIEPAVKQKVLDQFAEGGLTWLQAELKKVDPQYWAMVDLQNPHRLIRALTVSLSSGQPFSTFLTSTKTKRPFNVCKIGLNIDRDLLYQRINQRVDEMMKDGLLEEVRALIQYKDRTALQTVGYREIFEHLEGKIDLDTAIELIKRNTRRYAKRQLTWWRKDEGIQWFLPKQKEEILDYILNVCENEK